MIKARVGLCTVVALSLVVGASAAASEPLPPVAYPAGFPYPITVGGVTVYEPTTVPETTTTLPPTTVTLPPVINSGVPMPLTAPANFPTTVLREDFNAPAAEGQFLAVYQPRGISAYPNTYRDTRSKIVGTTDPLNFGTYDPNIISVHGSAMWLNLRTINGSVRVAAPVPYLDPSNTGKRWRDAKNVRVSIAWRSDLLDTRKMAWLLWPSFGTNTTGATSGVGGNGEIDFPEANLNGSSTVSAFVHWQNGTTGNSQTVMPSSVKAAGSGWHVSTYEWLAGVSFKAWLDGNLIGSMNGDKVPAEAMHLVLQTETILTASTALKNVSGSVAVDWITVERP